MSIIRFNNTVDDDCKLSCDFGLVLIQDAGKIQPFPARKNLL